jgi:DNA polymerase-3 subunit beta
MKFTINSSLLAEAITAGISSVPSRPSNPVMAGVLIEASTSWVTFSSFNYDRATIRTAAADVAEPDDAVVSGRLLALVGSNLPKNVESSITTAGNEMVIATGRTEFRLPMMHRADYPTLPVLDATSRIGSVGAEAFADAVRIIGTFASTDEKLVNITALNIACDPDGLVLTATDRYVVGRRRLAWSGTDCTSIDVAATDLMATIRAVASTGTEDIEILWDGALLGLRTPSATVITRSLAEKFPDIGRVIANAQGGVYHCSVTVPTADLASMLRRAAAIADDQNDQVDIVVDDGSLTVNTTNSGTGNVEDAVTVEHHGGARRLAVNSKRLLNALNIVDDTNVTLQFQSEDKPPGLAHMLSIFPGAYDPGVGEIVSPTTDSTAIVIGIRTNR